MIENLAKRPRVLIVGSAPGLHLPSPIDGEFVIAANGGAAIAARAGYAVDALCTTTYLFRDGRSKAEQATIDSLSGLRIGTVLVDDMDGSTQTVMMRLHAAGVSVRHGGIVVTPQDRKALTQRVLGTPLRISTGVWAACLAVDAGSRRVLITGINPNAIGHQNIPWDKARRDHVVEDYDALVRLQGLYGVQVLYPRAA